MSLRLKLRMEAGHGIAVPPGWRMAWYEPQRRVGVYYPAPLHWIVRVLRESAYRLRIAIRAPRMERANLLAMHRAHCERQRLADEYARGYLAGWHECFHTCLEAVEQEISRADKVWDVGDLLAGTPRSSGDN
ncbi:MAG TPA: hypothetical protein VMD78_10430 [Candidatus Baltobacteraceae bacterium]|nr:hypothetical protein [Candidatus Baltobacteraceae bacterium]